MGNTQRPLDSDPAQHSQTMHTQISAEQHNPFKPALATHSYMGHRLTTLGHRDGERRIGFDLPACDLPGQKGILIYVTDTEFVRIEQPFSSGPQTVAWLLQAVLKKLKEEKKEAIVNQFLKTKSVTGFRCRTSKSECMDYLLTRMETDIQFLTDNDILETVYATKHQFISKRKPMIWDFEFLKVIGKGGFSNVYQVRKKDEGKIYALKGLKKHLVKSENKVKHVMNEKAILSLIEHPFIVKMNWAFQSEHYLFMVLDFCAGGEIFYHMNKVQRFSEKMAKFYFAEILLAIEYLHSKNIFYRDLKPENVLLDEDGHIKLADFGISRCNFSSRERSNSFCGSPEYMSPEMLKQDRIHSRTVDFYSLGCLLYEMLTGLPPHFSENREEMYRRILHNPVDYPRYLSINSKNILKALLTKDPQNRLGSMLGAKEIKEHPFCKDINWDSVLQKKLIPPIKPSLRYSNFDQEYTTMPIRFTFEEDFVEQGFQRRKSDPGLEQSMHKLSGEPSPHHNAGLFNINGFNRFIQGASHLWNNPTEIEVRHKDQQENQGVAMTLGNAPKQKKEHELIEQDSPSYSRPPSSTFKGYSFMNFRNDSVSSVGGGQDVRQNQSNFSQLETIKQKQSSAKQGTYDSNPSKKASSKDTGKPTPFTSQLPLAKHTANKTPLQKKGDLDPASQTKNMNIMDDYEFTQSQRSRTISFANQSILTDGIEGGQKEGSKDGRGGFLNQEEQKEVEKLIHKSSKGLQTPGSSYKSGGIIQHQIGGSPSTIGHESLTAQRASATYIGIQAHGHTSDQQFKEVMREFDFQKDSTLVMLNMDIMHDIKEENEQDSQWGNESRLRMQEYINQEEILKKKKSNDIVLQKIANKLQDNRKLDSYEKNMIKFHDAIHSVQTERKRKKAQQTNKQTQKIKDIKTKNVRKVTRSLYQNEAPMQGVAIENRMRGESNYTAKSDHCLRESSNDRESMSSGGKNQKFQSTRMTKKVTSGVEKNHMSGRKDSKSTKGGQKGNGSNSKAQQKANHHMSPVGDSRNGGATFSSQSQAIQKLSNLKNASKTMTTGLKMPSSANKQEYISAPQEIISPQHKKPDTKKQSQNIQFATHTTQQLQVKKPTTAAVAKSRNIVTKGIAKSHIQPPLSTKNQKLNQSQAATKTLLPRTLGTKKKMEEKKLQQQQQELKKVDDDDMEVAVVSENPTDMIHDWQQHRAMDSQVNFTSSQAIVSPNFAQTLQPKKITRYNSPKGDLIQESITKKVAVASIAIPQTSRNAVNQAPSVVGTGIGKGGSKVSPMKGNRHKTNSQWAQSSLKKDLIDIHDRKTTTQKGTIALGTGPKKQRNADQLPQKKLAERHKSSGSRSYRCQSDDQDLNIDEFNQTDEVSNIDQMKQSILSNSIHQNQGKHYVNQALAKEGHITSNASLLTTQKLEKQQKEIQQPKKIGKNTPVVNLNSMHERLKSSFLETSRVPKEAIEEELLVKSPEKGIIKPKQGKILSGETKLQHVKASNSIVEQKQKSPFHPSTKTQQLAKLNQTQKKKSNNLIGSTKTSNILTQSYASSAQVTNPTPQASSKQNVATQPSNLAKKEAKLHEDDHTVKAFSFREESEQTPVPISTYITVQTQPNNSSRETPHHHQKSNSISKQLSDCKIQGSNTGITGNSIRPGSQSHLDSCEQQSSMSSMTHQSNKNRLSGGQAKKISGGSRELGIIGKKKEEEKKTPSQLQKKKAIQQPTGHSGSKIGTGLKKPGFGKK